MRFDLGTRRLYYGCKTQRGGGETTLVYGLKIEQDLRAKVFFSPIWLFLFVPKCIRSTLYPAPPPLLLWRNTVTDNTICRYNCTFIDELFSDMKIARKGGDFAMAMTVLQ